MPSTHLTRTQGPVTSTNTSAPIAVTARTEARVAKAGPCRKKDSMRVARSAAAAGRVKQATTAPTQSVSRASSAAKRRGPGHRGLSGALTALGEARAAVPVARARETGLNAAPAPPRCNGCVGVGVVFPIARALSLRGVVGLSWWWGRRWRRRPVCGWPLVSMLSVSWSVSVLKSLGGSGVCWVMFRVLVSWLTLPPRALCFACSCPCSWPLACWLASWLSSRLSRNLDAALRSRGLNGQMVYRRAAKLHASVSKTEAASRSTWRFLWLFLFCSHPAVAAVAVV